MGKELHNLLQDNATTSKKKESSDILTIDDLNLSYDGQKTIFKNVSLEIEKSEFVSIIGPSGCGKSSLLNVIAGFVQPTNGEICVNKIPVKKPGPDRAVVFQDLALFPWLNVIDNVALGLKIQGVEKKERIEKSMEVIQLVGLSGYEHKSILDLSGGMKQRVAIARTLVTNPEILLMDEPFSALDAQTRENMQDELLSIQEKTGMTIILVTHSIDEAVFLSDRVVIMQNGGGEILDVINVALPRPRNAEVRLTSAFNEYKRQLIQNLKEGHTHNGEQLGSGI
ncbi:ABC transporter ATP-binding protein [Domibacillus sp. A3M-37]|uniref:ABC transporter ATP-binding protein n=1 Tax=Domibacillus sp. A3M-37 TaxID=2962037 RepID=UPI0020B672D0|nr:ABC transporter ATP-binding protein [Domibacillus sp. A3M-37]MCP3764784.1 ABC transporter ATP-binding protein [Domibacillus sp. A3M-37]